MSKELILLLVSALLLAAGIIVAVSDKPKCWSEIYEDVSGSHVIQVCKG